MIVHPRRGDIEKHVSTLRIGVLILAAATAEACGYRGGPLSRSAKTGYCPVCKMRVTLDAPLTCQVLFTDDTKLMFESPGDMIEFYLAPGKYGITEAQKDRANILKMLVRDYETHEVVGVESATLVYKSRVKGPMGDDIFAFKAESDAQLFVSEHGGSIMVLSEITPEMIRDLRK